MGSARAIAVLCQRRALAAWQGECVQHLRAAGHDVCLCGPGEAVPAAALVLDLTPHGDPRAQTAAQAWFLTEPGGPRIGSASFTGIVAAGGIVGEVCLVERRGGRERILRWGRFRLGSNIWKSRALILCEVAQWPALGPQMQPYGGGTPARSGGFTAFAFSRNCARSLARSAFERIFVERAWHSYLIASPPSGVVARAGALNESMQPLPGVAGQFFADPFYVGTAQAGWIFGEAWDRAQGKGFIAATTLPRRNGDPIVPVFERRSHLSYPFLFTHDGELYCMPENSEEGHTTIYRCVKLPDRWEVFARILPGRKLCDATLLFHAGRWWLFAGDTERNANVNLFLFSAPQLQGPWEPHPGNPVKTDVSSARPAGAIFSSGGALLRPSQDCSRYYGAGVVINRIETLTREAFVETEVERLCDVHTFNEVSGQATLVDRVSPAFSLRKPYDRLMRAPRRGGRLEDAVPPNHARRAALAFPVIWKDRKYLLPEAGAAIPGPYYITWQPDSGVFGEDWDRSPFDRHGVLLSLRGGFYHPIHIAQYGLHQHARWKETGAQHHRDAFLAQARWFRDNQRAQPGGVRGAYPFEFPWPRYHAQSGWISAMAQGEAVSVLLRAHAAAPDDGFESAAILAAEPFRYPLEEGGVTARDSRGLFFEEVAAQPAAHILNGHIFALFGLWELARFGRCSWAAELVQEAVASLERSIHAFDSGYWSYYSLAPDRSGGAHLATHKYHAFHIAQLRVLAAMSGSQTFARTADRWRDYARDRGARLRVTRETLGGLLRPHVAR